MADERRREGFDLSERFFEPEASPTAELLERVLSFLVRFVVLGAAERVAAALWVLHTHVFEVGEASPYLAVLSPEKRCGKTTLLKLLGLLCRDAWRVITPSEAVMYRKIDRDRPTVILDEIDTVFTRGKDTEPLRALLNAGNEPGTLVPRCGGPNRDRLDEFHVYCPKAFAGIGEPLPDTVLDRSIVLRLERKTADQAVERFRRRDAEAAAEPLYTELLSWAEIVRAELEGARPDMPDELDDRAVDAWEPLFAIADLAGGEWPARARQAALALSTGEAREDSSIGVSMLASIRAVVKTLGMDRIATGELIAALCEDEEAPWATWSRGQPITSRALARVLRPYGIRSRTIRLADGGTPKGFLIEQFEPAWARYLPEATVQPPHPPQAASQAASAPVDDPPHSPPVAEGEHGANPHQQALVAAVADTSADQGYRAAADRPDDGGAPLPGDPGFLARLRAAYRAETLTRSEWLERVGVHGGIVRAAGASG